jgi:hypothetical protein
MSNHHDGMEPIFFTPPSGKTSGPRRLYKGKGGGAPATDPQMLEMMRQQQAQTDRLAQESAARQPDKMVVEQAANYPLEQEKAKEAARLRFYQGVGYNDPNQVAAREKQYGQMSNDVVDYHRTRLDRERNDALRQVGFNLARQGLSGSSQDAYDREQLQRKYLEGVTDINSKASNAAAQSKSGFESAVSRGLQAINSGSDASTQITSALQEKANTLQQALETAKGGTWGGFFGDLASTADTAKINAQKGLVKAAVDPNQSLLSGGAGGGGGSGSTNRSFNW